MTAAIHKISFQSRLSMVEGSTLLRLPEVASKKLPSRGQVAVRGTINGVSFETVIEPDGYFGHWIRVDPKLRRSTGLSAGDHATVEIEPVKAWPEPALPRDFKAALVAAPPKIQAIWDDITPMARWEWVRWIDATNNPETRKRRVEVSISKMNHGKRRPCCFDLSSCTDPSVSRSGRLIGGEGVSPGR